MLVNSACVVAIAVLLFPVLRRHSDRSAHAFLVEGPITAMILAVGVILLLLLVPLGQEYTSVASHRILATSTRESPTTEADS